MTAKEALASKNTTKLMEFANALIDNHRDSILVQNFWYTAMIIHRQNNYPHTVKRCWERLPGIIHTLSNQGLL